MEQSIEKLDPRFATPQQPEGKQSWHDIREFNVEGRAFDDTAEYYDRFPARAQAVVRQAVWSLSQQSAGMRVHFVTDACRISARWTLRNETLALRHMPATGVSGLDLYVRHEGHWRWVGLGVPKNFPHNEIPLVTGDLAAGRKECQVYLPLYNGVSSVEIGVPDGATIEPAPPYAAPHRRPICFYGTSVVQGGCASRPGMAYPAILGRRLDWPHYNFGFSGNGKIEPEVAKLLAEIDAAVYVLDALANNKPEDVRQRLAPFVRSLRQARPDTPILLLEMTPARGAFFPEDMRRAAENNAVTRQAYVQLLNEGMTGLELLPGKCLLGTDGEATVDGAHPTDLGFLRLADALEPALRRLLTTPG